LRFSEPIVGSPSTLHRRRSAVPTNSKSFSVARCALSEKQVVWKSGSVRRLP